MGLESIGLVIILALIVIFLIVFFNLVPLSLWISAVASGVHVSIGTLVGMRFRRINPSRKMCIRDRRRRPPARIAIPSMTTIRLRTRSSRKRSRPPAAASRRTFRPSCAAVTATSKIVLQERSAFARGAPFACLERKMT